MRYWEDDGQYYTQPRHSRWRSVVRTLIILNIVIFVAELLVNLNNPERFYDVFEPFGLSPQDVFHKGWVWQFVSYAFLHDPQNVLHIVFNMLFLYWFGTEIEQIWGGKRFVWFYLGAAAFAGICFVLIGRPGSWCIGASGAIYAIVMAYRLYWPNRIILFMLFFPMRIKTFVWIVIAVETYSVITSNPHNGVANAAHLGGLLFGYVVLKFGPALSGLSVWRRSGRRQPGADDERRRDEILDKVSREGIGSLTWWDRRFLRKFRRD